MERFDLCAAFTQKFDEFPCLHCCQRIASIGHSVVAFMRGQLIHIDHGFYRLHQGAIAELRSKPDALTKEFFWIAEIEIKAAGFGLRMAFYAGLR